jgi:hypothetical protein
MPLHANAKFNGETTSRNSTAAPGGTREPHGPRHSISGQSKNGDQMGASGPGPGCPFGLHPGSDGHPRGLAHGGPNVSSGASGPGSHSDRPGRASRISIRQSGNHSPDRASGEIDATADTTPTTQADSYGPPSCPHGYATIAGHRRADRSRIQHFESSARDALEIF